MCCVFCDTDGVLLPGAQRRVGAHSPVAATAPIAGYLARGGGPFKLWRAVVRYTAAVVMEWDPDRDTGSLSVTAEN